MINANLSNNLKFRLFMGFAAILFFFKIFATTATSTGYTIINEILVALTVISLVIYLIELMGYKKINPISMVMNVGILNAIIFFLISFSGSILNLFFDNLQEQSGLIFRIITFFYVFLILSFLAYIFLTFRELFFLKQNRNLNTYFNTMIVFFILASLSSAFDKLPDLSFVKNTFFIISIMLIAVNSVRISWIAFLQKKEKITLLIISVVIAVLFIVNLVNSSGENIHYRMLASFSPSLAQFLNILMIYGAIYFSVLFFTTLFHLPTAEAYDRKAQEISSLQYFSKLITEVLDFNDLAETVTDIATKVCNADAAWILWSEQKEYSTVAHKNIGFIDARIVSDHIYRRLENRALSETEIISLEKFEGISSLSEHYLSVAVSPLKIHNEVKGYLIVAKKNSSIFNDEDVNAINTFSDYATVAIDNARLLEESIEKERLEKELDVAREVQRKILPLKHPEYNGLDISSVFIPAFEVGGDYYDFFEINENKLGFVIADVSGKGISAAFIMAEVKGIFESLSKTIIKPKDILTSANMILKRTLDRSSFVSAAYGIIDNEKETLTISRAGHCPVILIRNGIAETLRPSGIGLGLNFTEHFDNALDETKIELQENDLIVLYTDGITEAKNVDLEDFGVNNFEKILVDNAALTPDEIANKVIREVTVFSQSHSQYDDITLVIFKWKSKIKSDGEREWQNSVLPLKIKEM
jgi:sigma-B regulation protein RsbU (phosphoserine phosphatase)